MQCYNFSKIEYPKGFLDSSVDATYIIHLEGNGRLQHIYEQLSNYHPTRLVYILFNKGYKKCNKKIYPKTSYTDLVDAFLKIFKHATESKYNNILVLEDDFIFDSKVKDPDVITIVNNFILQNRNIEFVYCLGVLPYFMIPYDMYHYKVITSSGTHANVYSKKLILNMLNLDQKTIIDWDPYHNSNTTRYTYYKPLCYQLFPETENSKNWVTGSYHQKFLSLLNLDKSIEPGYSIFYALSKIIFYILILLFIFSLYLIYKYFKL